MTAMAELAGAAVTTQPADARPTVGIVGCGFVGQAMLRLFGDCPVYDPAKGQTDKAAINRCRFAFVCVPTPTGPRGECDVSLVEETVRWVESEVIVIRSTVAPGTTDRLRHETGKRIVFQPEYIGETVAIIAASEQHRFTPPLLRAVMAVNAAYRQHDVAYRPFLSVMGPPRSDPFGEGPGNRPGGC